MKRIFIIKIGENDIYFMKVELIASISRFWIKLVRARDVIESFIESFKNTQNILWSAASSKHNAHWTVSLNKNRYLICIDIINIRKHNTCLNFP